MKWLFVSLLFFLLHVVFCVNNYYDDETSYSNETIYQIYETGIEKGIIDPNLYSYSSFYLNENNIFKEIYKEYKAINESVPITYRDWLTLNNYGIIPDTKEPLFGNKKVKRSTVTNKRNFVNAVRKGDILITGRGLGGFLGHAALMTTDYYVLEMPGGPGYKKGLKSNNRQLSKHAWFDKHARDWTTVYRCPDRNVAHAAANWADRHYWNPRGGKAKKIHITYKIDHYIYRTNPSYCSKLVIHAYYFGTGKKKVIKSLTFDRVIIPTNIPVYFKRPYVLKRIGRY